LQLKTLRPARSATPACLQVVVALLVAMAGSIAALSTPEIAAGDSATYSCNLSGAGGGWDGGGYGNQLVSVALDGTATGTCIHDGAQVTSTRFQFNGTITSYGCDRTPAAPAATATGTLTATSTADGTTLFSTAFTYTVDPQTRGQNAGQAEGDLGLDSATDGRLKVTEPYSPSPRPIIDICDGHQQDAALAVRAVTSEALAAHHCASSPNM
jgi:hypothetical protein